MKTVYWIYIVCFMFWAVGCDDTGKTGSKGLAAETDSVGDGTDGNTNTEPEENGTDSELAIDTDSDPGCLVGSKGCACAPQAMCDLGLVCDTGVCVLPADIDLESDTGADGDADTDADACGDMDKDYGRDWDDVDVDGNVSPDVDRI